MLQDIVIAGAGGFAREVAFLLEEINRLTPTWNILGHADRDKESVGKSVGHYSVIGTDDDLMHMSVSVALANGRPDVLRTMAEKLQSNSRLVFPNLVHPSTIWDKDGIQLGRGNIICARNTFTTNIRMGSFNVFNLNCTCGHDVCIGDYCVMNPGANISGGVQIADRCLIGAHATVVQYVKIGTGAIVGAGSVAIGDVEPDVTVMGVPANPVLRPRLSKHHG